MFCISGTCVFWRLDLATSCCIMDEGGIYDLDIFCWEWVEFNLKLESSISNGELQDIADVRVDLYVDLCSGEV